MVSRKKNEAAVASVSLPHIWKILTMTKIRARVKVRELSFPPVAPSIAWGNCFHFWGSKSIVIFLAKQMPLGPYFNPKHN